VRVTRLERDATKEGEERYFAVLGEK